MEVEHSEFPVDTDLGLGSVAQQAASSQRCFSCFGTFAMSPRQILVSNKIPYSEYDTLQVTLQCSPHSGTIRVSSLTTHDYKAYRNIGFCQSLWVIQQTLPEFSLRLTRSREICLKFANGSKAIRGPKTAASHRPCLVCKSNENHLQGINIIITAAQRTLTT